MLGFVLRLVRPQPQQYWISLAARVRSMVLTSCVTTVGLCLSAVCLSFDLRSLEHPATAKLIWVGERIEHNGMPMQVLQIESSHGIDELFQFYRANWAQWHRPEKQASVEKQAGEWRILSTLLDRHNIVLQLQESATGSSGFVSATPLDKAPEQNRIASDFPRQWGTELISSTESWDGGAPATTLVMKNSYSVDTNQEFYLRSLQASGWSLAHSSRKHGTSVMFFDRDSGALELAIQRDAEATIIFANLRGGGV